MSTLELTFRRTFTAIAQLGSKGGGSTITQQLAKLLFHQKEGRGRSSQQNETKI